MCEKSSPCRATVPALGTSRPPSRCNKVLLPEPELPTIARRSPLPTSRVTSRKTVMASDPSRNVFVRPTHASTGVFGSSLIAQRRRGIHARRAPARIQGRNQGQHERQGNDRDHVAREHLGGQLVDVVHLLVPQRRAGQG